MKRRKKFGGDQEGTGWLVFKEQYNYKTSRQLVVAGDSHHSLLNEIMADTCAWLSTMNS
jgi:hypothetical protein